MLDDILFEITPESYLLDCEDLPGYVCDSKDYCLFGIESMDSEMGEFTNKIFILGETFVKNFYTVFEARVDVYLNAGRPMDASPGAGQGQLSVNLAEDGVHRQHTFSWRVAFFLKKFTLGERLATSSLKTFALGGRSIKS